MIRRGLLAGFALLLPASVASRSTAAECSSDDTAEAAIAVDLYSNVQFRTVVCGFEHGYSPADCDLRVFEDLLSFRRVRLRDTPEVAGYFVRPTSPNMSVGMRGDAEDTLIWLFSVAPDKVDRLLTFEGDSLDFEPGRAKRGYKSLLGIDPDHKYRFDWDGRSYRHVPPAARR
jgi:hypothetical protein